MKIFISIVVLGVVLLGAFFVLNNYIYIEKQGQQGMQPGYDDVAYTIDGTYIELENGLREITLPYSETKVTTKIFGNEAEGDLNSDGVSDIAFILTQNTGGSGTFYYAVAALKTDTGYKGTNGFFLGDRIAPQSTEIQDGVITVNYADRKEGEPMTATPSVGVSKMLAVTSGVLAEKAAEGEVWILSTPNAQGMQFSYPKELGTTYIHAEVWPPEVELTSEEFVCEEGESREVQGSTYCVKKSSEGAAGSMYTTYAYATDQGDFVAHVTLTLRTPQCLNYEEEEREACAEEQGAFNVDELVNRIAQSIRML